MRSAFHPMTRFPKGTSMPCLLLLLVISAPPARGDGFAEDLRYGNDTLADYLVRLRDVDGDERIRASRVILANTGNEAWRAAPAVLMALKNADPKIRERLAVALGRMGPRAVPALTAALHFDDDRVRQGAAIALAHLGPHAAPAIPAFRNILNNSTGDAPHRVACYGAWHAAVGRPPASAFAWLSEHWPAGTLALANRYPALLDVTQMSPHMQGLLSHADDNRRRQARQLALLAGREAISPLAACLTSSSARARLEAAEALGEIGSPLAVSALSAMARKGTPGSRAAACRALGRIGDVEAIPTLRTALRAGPADVSEEAARALHRFGPTAEAALPELKEALASEAPGTVKAARFALARIGKAAVPVLMEMAKSEDEFLRGQAVRALREMGPAAALAADSLASSITGKGSLNPDLLAALEAMGAAGVTHLARLASEGNEQAAEALGRLGPLAGPAIGRLSRALAAVEAGPRRAIIRALGAIGPAARDAAKALLDCTDASMRPAVLEALPRIGVPGRECAEYVGKSLESPAAAERLAALRCLAAMPAGAIETGPLSRNLRDADEAIFTLSAELLLREGKAETVQPALKKRLASPTPALLRLAAWARGKDLVEPIRPVLKGEDIGMRVLAAHAILRIEPNDPGAVKALVGMIRSPRERFASHLFEVVAQQSGRAVELVPELLAVCDAKEGLAARLLAAEALGAFGKDAEKAAPAILAAMAQVGADIEETALLFADDGTRRISETSPLVDVESLFQLRGPMKALQDRRAGAAADAAAALVTVQTDLEGRFVAALSRLGESAVSAASSALTDDRTRLRRAAALFLLQSGGKERPLRTGLSDPDPLTAARCAVGLARQGDRSALPVLLRGLHGEESVAAASLEGLEALGDRGSLPAVASAFRRLEPAVRVAACRTLAKGEQLARVQAALSDRSALVRIEAARLLWKADRTFDILPSIRAALDDEDSRLAGLEAAAELGDGARPLSGRIRELMNEGAVSTKIAAARALRLARGDVVAPGDQLQVFVEAENLRPALRLRSLAEVGKPVGLFLPRMLAGPLPPGALRDALVKMGGK